MNTLLVLAFIFFIGSTLGWVIELFFRRFFSRKNPERKWINPGFCVGPWLPIYGTAACILFSFAAIGDYFGYGETLGWQIVLFILMSLTITVVEYFAGIVLLKCFNTRLWDYRKNWGNIHGMICPKFTFFWVLLAAAYYWLIHPYFIGSIYWLSEHLAFSFFIGLFFGFFIIDVVYSTSMLTAMKDFGKENDVIVNHDDVKQEMVVKQAEAGEKTHFFTPYRSKDELQQHMEESLDQTSDAMYKKTK